MTKRFAIAGSLIALLAAGYLAIDAVGEHRLTATFNRIYAEGTWGTNAEGRGTSGTGSTMAITREYRAYIENFIRTHRVTSVVDAGCGDWGFSSAIDWGGASYLGIDIASDVIDDVRASTSEATSGSRSAISLTIFRPPICSSPRTSCSTSRTSWC